MKSAHKKAVLGKVIIYAILILIAVVMIIPFLWMLSASIKSDREVFQMNPFVWIPANPKWDNYLKIWTKIPFGRFCLVRFWRKMIVLPGEWSGIRTGRKKQLRHRAFFSLTDFQIPWVCRLMASRR